jgi:hypothetical protein
MFLRMRPVAVSAIGLIVFSCAENPSAPPPPPPAAATAEPTPVPTPAPTSTPTPEPTAEPSRLAPGPVHHVHIKVHAIRLSDRSNFRPVFEEDGAWILFAGETAIVDATPKNAADKHCDYKHEPEWTWDESVEGLVKQARSPNPFLLWLDATDGRGTVSISATIDDAPSNGLLIEVRRQ